MYEILKEITKDMDETEWLKVRRQGIGGSDVGTICGVNPYSCILEVYDDKVLGKEKEFSDTAKERMHWGSVLEDVIADEFAKRNNLKISKLEAVLKSSEYPFALANIDRLVGDHEAILEIKTTSERNKEAWISGDIPLSYIYQIQWYMMVTGIEKAYLACLVGGQTYLQFEIEYNKDLIFNEILPKAHSFWEHNVTLKVPPVIDGTEASTDYINDKFKEVIEADPVSLIDDVYDLYAGEIIHLKKEKKSIEKQIEEYQNYFKLALKQNSQGFTKDYEVNWKSQKRSIVDTEKLKQDGIYEDYVKETNSRVFTIKKAKV